MALEMTADSTNTGEATVTTPPETRDEVVVNVPRVSRSFEARKDWILNESRQSVNRLAIASRKAGTVPNLEDAATRKQMERAKRLLTFLEHNFEIEPRYRDEAKVGDILKIIFDNAAFHFPDDMKSRARALYEDFEANDWGAVNFSTQDNDAEQQPNSPVPVDDPEDGQPVDNVTMHIRLPPPHHPIWGVHGIMHGVCPKTGLVNTTQLDRRYLSEKRTAKVFGHNGLEPGAWFPTQLVALFHGAHGARMAGIYGNVVDGAYSVVVAGMYEDVDEDHGDIIYYSGPNSFNHTDPINPPGGTATYLERSSTTARPIRVLRTADRKGTYAPSVGIRYDGLYRVTGRSEKKNAKAGLFIQYILKRQDGQESLSDIRKRSPTTQQRIDYSRIKEYW